MIISFKQAKVFVKHFCLFFCASTLERVCCFFFEKMEEKRMKTLGYYNGKFGELDEMSIPMNDRVCWFGDGVYDAGLSRNYKIFALNEHIDRLFNSAGLPVSILFTISWSKSASSAFVTGTLISRSPALLNKRSICSFNAKIL